MKIFSLMVIALMLGACSGPSKKETRVPAQTGDVGSVNEISCLDPDIVIQRIQESKYCYDASVIERSCDLATNQAIQAAVETAKICKIEDKKFSKNDFKTKSDMTKACYAKFKNVVGTEFKMALSQCLLKTEQFWNAIYAPN